MREGIYVDGRVWDDRTLLTGFVVHSQQWRPNVSGLQIAPFTSCAMPFIRERAKARGVEGPVFVVAHSEVFSDLRIAQLELEDYKAELAIAKAKLREYHAALAELAPGHRLV